MTKRNATAKKVNTPNADCAVHGWCTCGPPCTHRDFDIVRPCQVCGGSIVVKRCESITLTKNGIKKTVHPNVFGHFHPMGANMTKTQAAKLGLIALQSFWKYPKGRPLALKLLSIPDWVDAVRPGLPKSIRKSGTKAMIALLDKDAFGKEFEGKFKKGNKTILC